MKIVILAGGKGTRLWPVSRNKTPKQIVPILQGKTLIEETLNRLKGEFSFKDVYILIGKEMFKEFQKIAPEIIKSGVQIMIEPGSRDTGPAMAFAAALLFEKFPEEPLLFMASDHYIRDKEALAKTIRAEESLVKKTGKLLDVSIVPEFPSTALGYTHVGKIYQEIDGVEVFEFKGHKEKPDFNTAKKMIMSGEYLWHANFYMWTPKKFLEAFKKYAPKVLSGVIKTKKLWLKGQKKEAEKAYSAIEKISIDYAVTEKLNPKDVLVVKGDFGWNDIGSWSALHGEMLSQGDEKQNVVYGDWEGIDTSNSFIMTTSKTKIITTLGIDDIIIVDTEDALLICPRGRSQEVKEIVKRLEEKRKHRFL